MLVGNAMNAQNAPLGKHGSNPVVVVDGFRVIHAEIRRAASPQQQALELGSDRFDSIYSSDSIRLHRFNHDAVQLNSDLDNPEP